MADPDLTPSNARFDSEHWEKVFNSDFFQEEVKWVRARREKMWESSVLAGHVRPIPIEQDLEEARKSGSWNSPRGAVSRFRRRREFKYPQLLGNPVPVDLIVWQPGEPPERWNTKLGGLPYWPAKKRWPRRKRQPMRFIAQICFADSRDILPDLPGNLLVLLVDSSLSTLETWDKKLFSQFWFRLAGEPLIRKEDLPTESLAPFPPYFGEILRTLDYPHPFNPLAAKVERADRGNDDRMDNEEANVAKSEAPSARYNSPNLTPEELLSYQIDSIAKVKGAKIGGAPFWPQDDVIESAQFLYDKIATADWDKMDTELYGKPSVKDLKERFAQFLFCLKPPGVRPSHWGRPMSAEEYNGETADAIQYLDRSGGVLNFLFYPSHNELQHVYQCD